MDATFASIESLKAQIEMTQKSFLLLPHRNLSHYEGMVLSITLVYDLPQKNFDLDLQWICFGLDLFGENLLENYTYRFSNLEGLLHYLDLVFQIPVGEIPLQYSICSEQFPDPIRDAANAQIFRENWERFEQDFRTGLFLDPSQELVYSSLW